MTDLASIHYFFEIHVIPERLLSLPTQICYGFPSACRHVVIQRKGLPILILGLHCLRVRHFLILLFFIAVLWVAYSASLTGLFLKDQRCQATFIKRKEIGKSYPCRILRNSIKRVLRYSRKEERRANKTTQKDRLTTAKRLELISNGGPIPILF